MSFGPSKMRDGRSDAFVMADLLSRNSISQRARRIERSIRFRLIDRGQAEVLDWNEIVERATQARPDEIGLDIFDTVLYRSLSTAAAVERLCATRTIARGLWPRTADDFLVARRRAFEADPDGSLLDWLSSPQFDGLVSPEEAHLIEVETEDELLSVVPGAAEAVAELRRLAPVTFVSDMHLPSGELARFLTNRGVMSDADRLVVSCEAKASKSSGTLFGHVWPGLRSSGERPTVVFVGNDVWSDGAQAADAGAIPVLARAANPTRIEHAMGVDPCSSGVVVSAAARTARLELRHSDPPASDIVIEGTQAMAHLVAAFVFWVKDECRRAGITHVEFLSRDGEVPLEVARAMPGDHWSGVNLGYLHCGRRAWSLAGASAVGVKAWIDVGTSDAGAFLVHSAENIPFAATLDRCGLAVQDLPPGSELRAVVPTRSLSSEQAKTWSDELRSGLFSAAIEERSVEAKRLIVDFLRQRGLPKEQIAVVDVGWRGQQAWIASALIREVTGVEPLHLHFGGDRVVPSIDQMVDIRRFALDDSKRPHPIRGAVTALETLLATGKPRLVGYERSASAVEEVFSVGATDVDNETRRALVEGALAVARAMPSHDEMNRLCRTERALVDEARSILGLFWNQPTSAEIQRYEGLRFESDDGGDVVGHVVRRYSAGELLGRDAVPRVWPAGSLVSTPVPFRHLVDLYLRARGRR